MYRQAKAGPSKASEATASALEAKLPYLLTFLGHVDDDVSTNVLEFATEYIAMLKVCDSVGKPRDLLLFYWLIFLFTC